MAEASTEDIAQQLRAQGDLSSLNRATALAASTGVAVPFAQWVKVDYPNSLESVITDWNNDEAAIPFSTILFGGGYDFTDFGSINLIDYDLTPRTSGIFKAVLARDWQVVMTLRTDNENYLTQQIKTSLMPKLQFDDTREKKLIDSGSKPFKEMIRFAMFQEGDYISLDTDAESDQVGQFALQLGGVKYSITPTTENIDDGSTVVLHAVYYYQEGHSVVNPDGTVNTGEDEVIYTDLLTILTRDGINNPPPPPSPTILLDADFFDYLIFGGIGFLVLTVLGLVKRGA